MRKGRGIVCCAVVGFCFMGVRLQAAPLGTAFSYQGQLIKSGSPVTDTCNFTFGLWDVFNDQVGNSPQGPIPIAVQDGIFTTNLNFGASAITGEARWLEITVQCPGDATPTTLSPRVELTPAPHALALPGVFPDTATGYVGVGTFVPTAKLDVTGNLRASGTIKSGNSIIVDGLERTITSDGDIEIHVAGGRAVRIESTISTPNIIAGYSGNEVDAGVVGATISGGGIEDVALIAAECGHLCMTMGSFQPNRVAASFGTIGGGMGNEVDGAVMSTICGGWANKANGQTSTVAGGRVNYALGTESTVGGGAGNEASGESSTVAGGGGVSFGGNIASGNASTVGGGGSNIASGQRAVVAGGAGSVASGINSTISGGRFNSATGDSSTIGGGQNNVAGNVCVDGLNDQNSCTDDSDCNGGICQLAFFDTVGGGFFNMAIGKVSTIGGGLGNKVTGEASTIAGGALNRSSGAFSAVGGGESNTAGNVCIGGFDDLQPCSDNSECDSDFCRLAARATVGGGRRNNAVGSFATIGGGSNNVVNAAYGTISGGGPSDPDFDPVGTRNRVLDDYGTIGGGANNQAGSDDGDSNSARYATVGGGENNTAGVEWSTIGGGYGNVARNRCVGGVNNHEPCTADTDCDGGSCWLTRYITIGGGEGNTASGQWSTVAGGWDNTSSNFSSAIGGGARNIASGSDSTVGGGLENSATEQWSTVGGGRQNSASGGAATVSGGEENVASGGIATIGGGFQNTASHFYATTAGGRWNTASAFVSTVSGGESNSASNLSATVGGGALNMSTGSWATVPGGRQNTAGGSLSLAAGNRSKANHDGSFVWGDSTDADVTSSADNEFTARTSGGARFFSNAGLTTGVQLAAGGGSWASISDRNVKRNIKKVYPRDVLERLSEVPIATWNYESQDESIRHIGPMAQDFHAAFSVGEDERYITAIDADGVALAAIQGLHELVKDKDCEIAELREQKSDLARRNAELEARLTRIESLLADRFVDQKEGAR